PPIATRLAEPRDIRMSGVAHRCRGPALSAILAPNVDAKRDDMPPLTGITVLDFTEYIAGPYCTMMLADMGAYVIKVERPEGDAWRHTAPVAPYEGRGYLGVNRGKRSIALSLDGYEGRAIAHKLAATADVG